MPRLRRRGHVLRDALTDQQTFNLLIGAFPDAFASDQERREAWLRHRYELSTNPLTRPVAWWDYESPEPRRDRADEKESDQLFRLGELAPEEMKLYRETRVRLLT